MYLGFCLHNIHNSHVGNFKCGSVISHFITSKDGKILLLNTCKVFAFTMRSLLLLLINMGYMYFMYLMHCAVYITNFFCRIV